MNDFIWSKAEKKIANEKMHDARLDPDFPDFQFSKFDENIGAWGKSDSKRGHHKTERPFQVN